MGYIHVVENKVDFCSAKLHIAERNLSIAVTVQIQHSLINRIKPAFNDHLL